MSGKTLDLICMGRAAVDLYSEQIGARLEDASSFAKYLGGSPANTAVASSNALCTVGLPRRRSSSSIQGRSSWIRL